MKKYFWYLIIFNLIIALINSSLRADQDCMDNSFHLDPSKGPDFKRYHYVHCTCPCSQYAQSFNRGRCIECWHYRIPRPLNIVRYNPKLSYDTVNKRFTQSNRACCSEVEMAKPYQH